MCCGILNVAFSLGMLGLKTYLRSNFGKGRISPSTFILVVWKMFSLLRRLDWATKCTFGGKKRIQNIPKEHTVPASNHNKNQNCLWEFRPMLNQLKLGIYITIEVESTHRACDLWHCEKLLHKKGFIQNVKERNEERNNHFAALRLGCILTAVLKSINTFKQAR